MQTDDDSEYVLSIPSPAIKERVRGGGCHRILMLPDHHNTRENKEDDREAIYLCQEAAGELIAYWYQNAEFTAHEIFEPEKKSVLALMHKNQNQVSHSSPDFKRIKKLCGYSRIIEIQTYLERNALLLESQLRDFIMELHGIQGEEQFLPMDQRLLLQQMLSRLDQAYTLSLMEVVPTDSMIIAVEQPFISPGRTPNLDLGSWQMVFNFLSLRERVRTAITSKQWRCWLESFPMQGITPMMWSGHPKTGWLLLNTGIYKYSLREWRQQLCLLNKEEEEAFQTAQKVSARDFLTESRRAEMATRIKLAEEKHLTLMNDEKLLLSKPAKDLRDRLNSFTRIQDIPGMEIKLSRTSQLFRRHIPKSQRERRQPTPLSKGNSQSKSTHLRPPTIGAFQ